MNCMLRAGIAFLLIQAPAMVLAQEDSLQVKNYREIDLYGGKPVGFTTIERAPMYPNGAAGINEHLRKNLQYPPEALKKRLRGEVIVDFVIGLDGKVEEARVVKSVHPLLDQEAVRVIEAMDRWIPARQGGKPVKMRLQKAIKFSRKA